MLICPSCRSGIVSGGSDPLICRCGEAYPRLASGGIDFLQGAEFADFDLDENDAAQRELLGQEVQGITERMRDFFIPLICSYFEGAGRKPSGLAVLDCGCGNGLSVDLLAEQGWDAWGIDAGRARHRQWGQRRTGEHLISANAIRLPFEDSAFDVVLSSGLIEHIGIHEEESSGYRSWRLPDCESQRLQFVAELVRVMRHDGFILLDHPHGSFPADFWHGGRAGSIRWHRPHLDMLPRFSEIARYFRRADPSLRLTSLSPVRRLSFRKVGAHWYGRVFAPTMRVWLRTMEWRPLSFLARSFLNPYLVTIASRQTSPLRVSTARERAAQ